jgi:hypothetical protein
MINQGTKIVYCNNGERKRAKVNVVYHPDKVMRAEDRKYLIELEDGTTLEVYGDKIAIR